MDTLAHPVAAVGDRANTCPWVDGRGRDSASPEKMTGWEDDSRLRCAEREREGLIALMVLIETEYKELGTAETKQARGTSPDHSAWEQRGQIIG